MQSSSSRFRLLSGLCSSLRALKEAESLRLALTILSLVRYLLLSPELAFSLIHLSTTRTRRSPSISRSDKLVRGLSDLMKVLKLAFSLSHQHHPHKVVSLPQETVCRASERAVPTSQLSPRPYHSALLHLNLNSAAASRLQTP